MRTSLLIAPLVLLVLSGCQELRGPVWSSDGKRLAFTAYTLNANGVFEPSLYALEADDENAAPELLAKSAAFPYWCTDNQTLFYLGGRDAQGFFSGIVKHRLGSPPQSALKSSRLVNLQMSADASLGLLCHANDARPGAPVTIELWNAGDGKLTDLRKLNEVCSPALMPNGKTIAYAQKPAAALPLLCICKLDGSAPESVFPTEKDNEPNATTYVIHALPDNDRFLFYAPTGSALWTVRRDGSNIRKYPLPENLSAPVMAAFAEDSTSVCVTLPQPAAGKILYQVYRLDFASGRYARLDGGSTELMGGHTLDPRAARRKSAARYAWLSAGGLALGDPNKARYFPLTGNQCVAASVQLLRQNEPQKAVAAVMKARECAVPPEDMCALERAEAHAYLADKQTERAAEALERSVLLYPVGPEGLKFIFPSNTGLPRPAPAEAAAAQRELDDLIKELPENRLLPLVRQALKARIEDKHREALDACRQALPLLPDEARAGGLRFLEAVCAFESGDLALAAEKWESAARCADFPQADYAAGLSAIAGTLNNRPDTLQRAASVLQIAAVRNSPLAAELAQLPAFLKGRPYVERNRSKESASADNSVRCWVESERCLIPFAVLNPVRVTDRDQKFVERRVGVRPVTASSVWLAGGQTPVFRIPRAISVPVISQNNTQLAFAVEGEVFPLPDTLCDIFVIDTHGALALGDPRAASNGQLQSRFAIKSAAWSGPQELSVTASEVDVFGGETPTTKTIPVPPSAPSANRRLIPGKQ